MSFKLWPNQRNHPEREGARGRATKKSKRKRRQRRRTKKSQRRKKRKRRRDLQAHHFCKLRYPGPAVSRYSWNCRSGP